MIDLSSSQQLALCEVAAGPIVRRNAATALISLCRKGLATKKPAARESRSGPALATYELTGEGREFLKLYPVAIVIRKIDPEPRWAFWGIYASKVRADREWETKIAGRGITAMAFVGDIVKASRALASPTYDPVDDKESRSA